MLQYYTTKIIACLRCVHKPQTSLFTSLYHWRDSDISLLTVTMTMTMTMTMNLKSLSLSLSLSLTVYWKLASPFVGSGLGENTSSLKAR